MSKFFAGIGSRETPKEILDQMEKIGKSFTRKGYILRSGGAEGADKAFEKFVRDSHKQIFYSWHATPEAIEIALKIHPNPTALKEKGPYVLGLMGRNIHIVSGLDLKHHVDFIVCWTKDGQASGGTGQALRWAEQHKIKIYNLYWKEHLENLRSFYRSL